jgi:hypothetical protein
MVYTPGIIAWAINGYHFEADRANLLNLVRETYKLPHEIAQGLLSQKIPYRVEDETVVIEVEAQ